MSQKADDKSTDEEVPVVLPLEIIDKSIGQKIRILMTNDAEFIGTLVGFDDFVNMVLENVQEFNRDGPLNSRDRMLLNGSHVAMLVPI